MTERFSFSYEWDAWLKELHENGDLIWTDSGSWPYGFSPTRIIYRGADGNTWEITVEGWINQRLAKEAVDGDV